MIVTRRYGVVQGQDEPYLYSCLCVRCINGWAVANCEPDIFMRDRDANHMCDTPEEAWDKEEQRLIQLIENNKKLTAKWEERLLHTRKARKTDEDCQDPTS